MQISKNSDQFKLIKNAIKTNELKDYTVSSDLQVLDIALKHNIEISLLLYDNEQNYHEDTLKLLNELKNKAKEYYEISTKAFEALSLKENHVGIIALLKMPKYDIDSFKNKDLVVVLDKIEIPGNLGTILRTLEAINASCIIVDGITKINSAKLTSASRGCNLKVPYLLMNYNEAQEFLINNNYDIYLGEPKLGKNYQEYDYKNKTALVFGNERFGINKKWYDNKHIEVFIPMEGEQNSINVSVAASIIAYEAYMKKR